MLVVDNWIVRSSALCLILPGEAQKNHDTQQQEQTAMPGQIQADETQRRRMVPPGVAWDAQIQITRSNKMLRLAR